MAEQSLVFNLGIASDSSEDRFRATRKPSFYKSRGLYQNFFISLVHQLNGLGLV